MHAQGEEHLRLVQLEPDVVREPLNRRIEAGEDAFLLSRIAGGCGFLGHLLDDLFS